MEVIINAGMKYFYQIAEGKRSQISSKQAWEIFIRWKKAGRAIRRKHGMDSRLILVWPE